MGGGSPASLFGSRGVSLGTEVLARHVFHLQTLPIRRRRPRLDVADETLGLGGSTGGSTHVRDIVLLAGAVMGSQNALGSVRGVRAISCASLDASDRS